ncbi:helix-turn-helix domain-containing protein [Paradevosia shaoguanensis]|uniref:Helix-turn-helix domain-containing protein n=1 Tax=Paradevosia shaoguanensis TaxID=1335043 RepID=A0AA41UDE1_9HYPH|nr:helix-turn-helix transcriptional regulator [Paradevosia shaoguanensis]MCF1744754.1 helix-turn-helix domain-containing protein [Paradevosia shaoguanensis]MCI0129237.1 helix-turn-helix domain-containing protein [Paradevosia shaoguanensis]
MSPLEWRTDQKLSQAAVAKMLGIVGKNPATTWQRWESGKREPPLSVVAKIEILSDGKVTLHSWTQLRRSQIGVAA